MDDELPVDEDDGAYGQQEPPRRRGRVAFATIEARTLGGTTREALLAALRPGTRKEHYQREWIMGQIRALDDGVIVGRIGFEHESKGGRWDDEAQDFVAVDLEDVTTSPFAISADGSRVVFQTRGQTIKPQSFVGAFQALLNAASPTERWRVHREIVERSFTEWLQIVSRVERIRVKLERPNPNYRGRRRVEDLLEGLNARTAEVGAQAATDDPQGLDTDDDLFEELIGHADAYGSYAAVGQDPGGQRVEFSTTQQTEESEAEVDPVTREVPPETLHDLLGEHGEDDISGE